jgi:hypothetical protein
VNFRKRFIRDAERLVGPVPKGVEISDDLVTRTCRACRGTGSATWKYPIQGCAQCKGDGHLKVEEICITYSTEENFDWVWMVEEVLADQYALSFRRSM